MPHQNRGGTPRRIPAALFTQKGADYLAKQASENTVVLTDGGKPTAVVMSPGRYDEMQRAVRDAANRVIAGTADLVAENATFRPVDDARERLHPHA